MQNVIATLDGATAWLIRSRKGLLYRKRVSLSLTHVLVPDPWATALVARLNLRKVVFYHRSNKF